MGEFPHESTEPIFDKVGETGFFLENAGNLNDSLLYVVWLSKRLNNSNFLLSQRFCNFDGFSIVIHSLGPFHSLHKSIYP